MPFVVIIKLGAFGLARSNSRGCPSGWASGILWGRAAEDGDLSRRVDIGGRSEAPPAPAGAAGAAGPGGPRRRAAAAGRTCARRFLESFRFHSLAIDPLFVHNPGSTARGRRARGSREPQTLARTLSRGLDLMLG